MSFANKNLKYLRKLRGWTQEEFAQKLRIKRSLLGAYEEERAEPRIEILEAVADMFKLTLDDLLRRGPDRAGSLSGIVGMPVGHHHEHDQARAVRFRVRNGKLVPDLVQNEFQKGYALVNARLGYTFDGRFKAEAFVNNLLDKHYLRDAGNTGDSIGLATFIAGEPRTYGVQFSAGF